MAERQLSQIASRDIERDGHDDVDAHLLEHAGLIAGDDSIADQKLAEQDGT